MIPRDEADNMVDDGHGEADIESSLVVDVLSILQKSEVKLSPQVYIKKIQSRFDISARQAKKILKQLIADQELCYQYEFGATYVEKSFLRPVRVTPHFVLKPFNLKPSFNSSNDIEILIEQGISFGGGQHPTTQLCLQAIDEYLFEKPIFKDKKRQSTADIGTGSGVLALAMCKAGMGSCQAYEIDPVSINEAKKNVHHNCLNKSVIVHGTLMPEQKNTYSIICANLRFPTLKQISWMIHSSLIDGGIAILSGVREWEKENLIEHFITQGFELIWQKDDKKWSGFVMGKNL